MNILLNDETRYFTASSEMIENGNFIVPTLNYEMYPDKPPFLFWVINLFLRLSKNYSIIRFILTCIPNLITIYFLGLIGTFNTNYLFSNIIFLFFSQGLMTDHLMYSALFINIYSCINNYYFSIIISSTIGFLIKGPIYLLNLLIYSYSFNIYNIYQVYGLSLGLIWFILALIFGTKEYREHILWKQWIGRAIGKHKHNKPFYFYIPFLPLVYNFLPNSLNFSTINSVIYILFYNISKSKLPHYLLGAVYIYSLNINSYFILNKFINIIIGLTIFLIPYLKIKNFDKSDINLFYLFGIFIIFSYWNTMIVCLLLTKLISKIYDKYYSFKQIIEICDKYPSYQIFYENTFYNGELNFLMDYKRKIKLGKISILPKKSIYICFTRIEDSKEILNLKYGLDKNMYLYIN